MTNMPPIEVKRIIPKGLYFEIAFWARVKNFTPEQTISLSLNAVWYRIGTEIVGMN